MYSVRTCTKTKKDECAWQIRHVIFPCMILGAALASPIFSVFLHIYTILSRAKSHSRVTQIAQVVVTGAAPCLLLLHACYCFILAPYLLLLHACSRFMLALTSCLLSLHACACCCTVSLLALSIHCWYTNMALQGTDSIIHPC